MNVKTYLWWGCWHRRGIGHTPELFPCPLCHRKKQERIKLRRPKASDISDADFYLAMNPPGARWTTIWDLMERLPDYPLKVILAKAKAMIVRRKTITGCYCGCRGDFEWLVEP